jgi:hypothetical protein
VNCHCRLKINSSLNSAQGREEPGSFWSTPRWMVAWMDPDGGWAGTGRIGHGPASFQAAYVTPKSKWASKAPHFLYCGEAE